MRSDSVLRKLVVAGVLGLSLPMAAMADAEAVKIATVDMQKALQTVESGKKAKATLEKEFNVKKKDLQNEEALIKKATEEFKKQSLVMSDEARNKKQNELQDRILKFQKSTADAQNDIQLKERELTQPIISKLKSIISETAKKKSYTVVLEKNDNNVLFSLDKDDLTNDVINAFDHQANSEKSSG